MLREIWEPDLPVVFVGTAVDELSDTLGFYHLHPRNRFWELLEIGGMTPTRIITPSERKALAEGHARGSLSDPVRSMFIQKKTSQLLRLGIGLTDLNRRVIAIDDKDKAARPTEEDIQQFIARVPVLNSKVLAFVTKPDLFNILSKLGEEGMGVVHTARAAMSGPLLLGVVRSTTRPTLCPAERQNADR